MRCQRAASYRLALVLFTVFTAGVACFRGLASLRRGARSSGPRKHGTRYTPAVLALVLFTVFTAGAERANTPNAAGPLFDRMPSWLLKLFQLTDLCAGPVVLVMVAALLFYLASRVGWRPRASADRASQRRVALAGLRTQLEDDGFWLEDVDLAPGTLVRYRCYFRSSDRTGQFRVAPGPRGQFVKTSEPPSDVEILDVLPPESAA
jgi:hypothetical protein